jgi:hypothetical protein
VHPEVTPVRVQVPVTALFFTVPCNVRVLPLGVPDWMVIPNPPVTFPLKFPLRVKDPVSVSPEAKHGDELVKLKLVTVTSVPLL